MAENKFFFHWDDFPISFHEHNCWTCGPPTVSYVSLFVCLPCAFPQKSVFVSLVSKVPWIFHKNSPESQLYRTFQRSWKSWSKALTCQATEPTDRDVHFSTGKSDRQKISWMQPMTDRCIVYVPNLLQLFGWCCSGSMVIGSLDLGHGKKRYFQMNITSPVVIFLSFDRLEVMFC